MGNARVDSKASLAAVPSTRQKPGQQRAYEMFLRMQLSSAPFKKVSSELN